MKNPEVRLSDRKIVVTRRGGERKYRFGGFGGFVEPDIDDETPDESPSVDVIDAPRRLSVEDETLRVRPDGTTVVDIVVCFDAPEGITEFEYRLSVGDNSLIIQ